MKAVKFLVFLFLLLLPFGSIASTHDSDELNSCIQLEPSEQFVQSHRTTGVLPENLIEYTISESTPEVVTGGNTHTHYLKNINTKRLYQSELESERKLLSSAFREIIIPSLNVSTLVYPFHSFL